MEPSYEPTPKPSYKSLTPKDPEFIHYMMGDFSETERALPQPSLNPHSLNEVVTFEIRKKENLLVASKWKKLVLLLKPQTWLTVLVPLIVISRLETGENQAVTGMLWVVLTLLMIFASWQADLADHLEGWDRLQGEEHKSVLQTGWYTGHQLRRWSQWLLGTNVLLAIPVLMKYPWVLVPYAVGVLALLLLLPRWWRKSVGPGVSSLCIFLLSGPLLTIGIDLAFDGQMTKNSFFLGLAWGLWMSFVRQQKIYTKQWRHYQKQSPYFFLGLGFDKAKAFMRLFIVVIPGLMLMPFMFVKGGAAWFFPLLVVHAAFVFWELRFNEEVQSSIGSSLKKLQVLFQWHFYMVSLVMVIGAIIWKTTLL